MGHQASDLKELDIDWLFVCCSWHWWWKKKRKTLSFLFTALQHCSFGKGQNKNISRKTQMRERSRKAEKEKRVRKRGSATHTQRQLGSSCFLNLRSKLWRRVKAQAAGLTIDYYCCWCCPSLQYCAMLTFSYVALISGVCQTSKNKPLKKVQSPDSRRD